ncbi:unnamed protein product [Ceratitis capitata]|uniref:(Mediterranean fruit fly) hypothetical protein n=1 Tax=Ceratitis capitata TaxID=7213 RepID=A0A811URJ9_CERCA|nr:unnamed protein product [Ceratitis capitata]
MPRNPINFANQYRPQVPLNNYRNPQHYRPFNQPPARPQQPRPEPMDVHKSLHSREVNYMNRHPNNNTNRPSINNNNMKRPSNFSQQVPLKQQRNYHIEASGNQDTTQDQWYQQYEPDQHYHPKWTYTPEEYEAALVAGQTAQTYAEINSQPEEHDHIDIHFLE